MVYTKKNPKLGQWDVDLGTLELLLGSYEEKDQHAMGTE